MAKMCKCLFLILIACALLQSYSYPALAEFVNGKTWQNTSGISITPSSTPEAEDEQTIMEETAKIEKTQQIAYLKGLYEGLRAEEIMGNRRSALLKILPAAASYEALAGELDKLYEDYGNRAIPVINALVIINNKMKGSAPEKIKIELENAKDANLNEDVNF